MQQPASDIASAAAIEHLRWSMVTDVGPMRFGRLIERFGSAEAALGAGAAQLAGVDGIGPNLAASIARQRDQVDVQAELDLAGRHGVRILCREDDEFPAPLHHIPDPPICLYVRGRIQPADAVAVAIVGSRRCTIYGREQAYRFGYQLGQRGVTVVSGLARGIDGEGHKGAMAAKGRTLAVLGNGLATLYPPEHKALADQILECGAIISELPMSAPPDRANFLPRNRLIAGLSLGTLVIEAALRSGSLSTARWAAEYNREVFAVPGRIDSDYSAGTNALIRDQHAKLVTNPADILDELGEAGKALRAGERPGEIEAPLFQGTLSTDEGHIYDVLTAQEQSIEMIADRTGQTAAKVASTLITLQLKGLVRQLPGNLFMRTGRL